MYILKNNLPPSGVLVNNNKSLILAYACLLHETRTSHGQEHGQRVAHLSGWRQCSQGRQTMHVTSLCLFKLICVYS